MKSTLGWVKRLEELVEFNRNHKNFNVCGNKSLASLYRWVNRKQESYPQYKEEVTRGDNDSKLKLELLDVLPKGWQEQMH